MRQDELFGWDGDPSLMRMRGGGACEPKTERSLPSLMAFFEREPALMKPLLEEARDSNNVQFVVRILVLFFFPPAQMDACEPLC